MKINLIAPLSIAFIGILAHQQFMNGHHMNPLLHLCIKLFPYLMTGFVLTYSHYQERNQSKL